MDDFAACNGLRSVWADGLDICRRIGQSSVIAMRLPLLVLLVAAGASSGAFNPFVGPKPIFVFIESDPWLMAPGSDTPDLVLYEDGELIFRSKNGEERIYRHQHLGADAVEQFKKRVMPLATVTNLKPWYDIAPYVSDQPTSKFYLKTEKGEVATQVYGLFDRSTKLWAWTEASFGPRPDRLPQQLWEVHKFVSSYDDPTSPEWMPKYVEIMLWDYDWTPTDLNTWPTQWPGLDSDRAVKWSGERYSVFLDGTRLSEAKAFFVTEKPFGVAGRRWSGDYRLAFASEPIWQKAFHKSQEHVPLTLRDRLENIWYTIEEAAAFFVHFWIPSAIFTLLPLAVGAIRLRAAPIPFSAWRWLLVLWLIPLIMLILTAVPGWHWLHEQLTPFRFALMGVLLVYIPVAITVVAISRKFRWFALTIALFQTWITLCVFVASTSAIW